jgi:hypothetical protein
MLKFPVDAPKEQVLKALMPNHRRIKGATLRTILWQSQIDRDEFLKLYDKL